MNTVPNDPQLRAPSRRTFTKGATLLLLGGAIEPNLGASPVQPGALQTPEPFDYSFVDYWSEDQLAGRLEADNRGVKPPLDKDVADAQRIIAKAPSSSPLAVMNYFADLKARGSTGELFNSRWKAYENPVVVWFFHATHTTPTGDCTSWCAAFLSWCLERCGLPSVHSASSQDYAKFGTETTTPKAGDVVVFQNTDDPGHGHVALLASAPGKDAKVVEVIGGNQGNAGAIPSCPKGYPVSAIGRATRSRSGDHGQIIRTFRRYA